MGMQLTFLEQLTEGQSIKWIDTTKGKKTVVSLSLPDDDLNASLIIKCMYLFWVNLINVDSDIFPGDSL